MPTVVPGQTTSLLTITGLSGSPLQMTPYSARGLGQSLDPIAFNAATRETINGETVNLMPAQFRKYQTTITCVDVFTPCLDGVWVGEIAQIECVVELGYPPGGSPQRPVVSGSSYESGGFYWYRPSLVMMITAIRTGFSEFAAAYNWQIDAREIKVPTV